MNYWINDFRSQLLETLKEWNFLLINDSEARLLSGEFNLRRAARRIMEMGPHTLVIKRGEYGAILFRRGGHFIAPGYLLEDVFDPTGAGDCFGRRLHRIPGRPRASPPPMAIIDPLELRQPSFTVRSWAASVAKSSEWIASAR